MSDFRHPFFLALLAALSIVGANACRSGARSNSVGVTAWKADSLDARSHIDVAYTPTVRSGMVNGVVVDAQDGTSIPRASARFAGTKDGVLVDSLGRFTLTSSSTQPIELIVEHIGFEPARAHLDLARAGGFVVRVSLLPDPACFIFSRPSVIVIVRDIRTGGAPTGPVTLTARAGRIMMKDSVNTGVNEDSAVLKLTGWDRGVYDLVVSGKEYSSWQRTGVSLPTMDCSVQTYYAWMLPAANQKK